MLPAPDADYLSERRVGYSASQEGGMICIVVPNWKLPPGFNVQQADLLLRLPMGYPDLPPDMWWFDPAVLRDDGQEIPATQATEYHLGKRWQRWSRHLSPEQWRSGVDGLGSFFTLIQQELARCAPPGRK